MVQQDKYSWYGNGSQATLSDDGPPMPCQYMRVALAILFGHCLIYQIVRVTVDLGPSGKATEPKLLIGVGAGSAPNTSS